MTPPSCFFFRGHGRVAPWIRQCAPPELLPIRQPTGTSLEGGGGERRGEVTSPVADPGEMARRCGLGLPYREEHRGVLPKCPLHRMVHRCKQGA